MHAMHSRQRREQAERTGILLFAYGGKEPTIRSRFQFPSGKIGLFPSGHILATTIWGEVRQIGRDVAH
jgi:hypothetical protein